MGMLDDVRFSAKIWSMTAPSSMDGGDVSLRSCLCDSLVMVKGLTDLSRQCCMPLWAVIGTGSCDMLDFGALVG